MKKILFYFDTVIRWLAMTCLSIMIFLVLGNVLLRYIFSSGIAWSEEGARICFVWVVFLGVILAARDNEHLIVDVLSAKATPKIAKLLDVLVSIITLFVMYAVVIGGVKIMLMTLEQPLPATGLPAALIYFAGVFGAGCLLIMTLCNLPMSNR